MAMSGDTVEINVTLKAEDTPPSLQMTRPDIQLSDSAPKEKPRIKRGRNQGTETPDSISGKRGSPLKRELISSRIRHNLSRHQSTGTSTTKGANKVSTPGVPDNDTEAIKMGKLWKVSRGRYKGSSQARDTKQKWFRFRPEARLFRLTQDRIEYHQMLNQVKVRRHYPLTSIEAVEYNESEPKSFKLIFPKYEMILEAESEAEAKSWADACQDACSKWRLDASFSFDEDLSPPSTPIPLTDAVPPDSVRDLPPQKRAQSQLSPPSFNSTLGARAAGEFAHNNDLLLHHAGIRSQHAYSNAPLLRRESTEYDDSTLKTRKRRNAFRLHGLTPRLKLPDDQKEHDSPTLPALSGNHLTKSHTNISDPESKLPVKRLHYNFAMVKYSRSVLGIPHERIFKIDQDNLQILWRRNDSSSFRSKSSLRLHKVLEVREGQLTDSFNQFPYDEVQNQSFSLIFEQETKKYVRLTSIDLICDHPDNYDQWIEGLKSLVSGTKYSIYPYRYENTDPLVLWLKEIWTCYVNHHVVKIADGIKLVRKFQPQTSRADAKTLVKTCHSHQFHPTLGTTDLHWEGFTLLYNLVCTKSAPSSRLNEIFKKYAVKHPSLGLTIEELRKLLIEECCWETERATDLDLQTLIAHHDYHHRAYKKYVAENKPNKFKIATKLLSYAGFLSFLRSKDNPTIALEHEKQYQDMTQPLSHYFINSSHNTYLEAGQLKGKSSLDAYIRVLLQGCRCVEIDCWDDTFNVTGLDSKEPVIYHGYTLTSKIPFREVIHTIRDYAFRTSKYPVIISIENHCSEDQQSKMAKIFRAIMGDVLPLENLVELEGRERLPSPLELQGKIILKGSFKEQVKGGTPKMLARLSKDHISQTSIQTNAVASLTSSTSLNPVECDPVDSLNSLTANGNKATALNVPSEGLGLRARLSSSARNRSSRRSLREVRNLVTEKEKGQDDQELTFEETSKDLKKLIVYCRSISIKPWSWRKAQQTTVSQMFSFGEPSAIKHCDRSQRDMLKCSERQMVRTYPKGSRFDSSNYDPVMMWNCGIQLVALNYQKPDIYMHLNQGLFRRNGSCGYVLKPAVMRKVDPGGASGGSAPYSPYMEVAHPDVPTVQLEIELLSGQNLCPWIKKRCAQLTVDIHTYGIQHDNAKMFPQATHTSPLWPQWEEGKHTLNQHIIMPELCLVYFRVEGDKRLLGQNCISLVSLQPGIKFVPMRTSGGELIPEAGLFVRIKKAEQSFQQHSRKFSKNTSFTSCDPLASIAEDVSGEEIGSSAKVGRFLQRQEDTEEGPEYSLARSTISSPPLVTNPGASKARQAPDVNTFEVEVEIETEPVDELESSLILSSLQASRVKSFTVQPSSIAPQGTVREGLEMEGAGMMDGLKEFTLTVQGSFDESGV